MAHEHEWTELRRQIPWTADDFDKDRLAPERARYAVDHPDESKRGQPHTDEDHWAKVAVPRPEVVLKCYGCDTVHAVPIPVGAYRRVVEMLASGELQTNDPESGNHLSSMPLRDLLPEMTTELDKLGVAGPGTTRTARVGATVATSNLAGEAAEASDARLREQLGLPSRDAAVEAVHASAEKYEAEGRKASTQPAKASERQQIPEVAPEVEQITEDGPS